MNWYKTARYEKDWNVIRIKPNLFQLQFKGMPITDFYPIERGNIKEVKNYGMNILKLPKDIILPPIIFMYSRAVDFITGEGLDVYDKWRESLQK